MIIEPQFRTPTADRLFSAEARIGRMVAFEVALAEAEAAIGLIPHEAATAIAKAARTLPLDADAIEAAAAQAGNPAIPLVAALTAAVASVDDQAAGHVHKGATSQDVLDTATMLAMRATVEAMEARLDPLIARLADLATTHARTPMAGRTLMQQATPITFGFKVATWRAGLVRARTRLAGLTEDVLAVQFGGATGTLATLGTSGPAVRAGLAQRLGLADPGTAWHGDRSRILDLAATFVALIGAAAKLARDVMLMMQTEVGELAERGAGGSSAMPHKRNPVAALIAPAALGPASGLLAAIAGGLAQEHERAIGGWHAEWIALPTIATLTLAAIDRTADLVDRLEVDADAMRANLDRLGGLLGSEALSAAIAETEGRTRARRLVDAAVERSRLEGRAFAAIVAEDPAIGAILGDRVTAILAHRDAIEAAAAAALDQIAGM